MTATSVVPLKIWGQLPHLVQRECEMQPLPFCGTVHINTDEYLDGMLDHLTGVRHAQDTPLKRINADGLSMAIQSCLFEPNFKYLNDVALIKRLLVSCWNDSLDIEILAPKVLSALLPYHISPKIHLSMITIACIRRDLTLLRYCFTLTDSDAVFWAATTSPILVAATATPDPIIWDVLLSYGWSRPNGQYWDICAEGLKIRKVDNNQTHQDRLANLALIAIKDSRRVELLNILFDHGLVVTNSLLSKAAASADPMTMKTLLENCEDDQELDTSKALLVAAESNGRIIEVLLDGGFHADWKAASSPPSSTDRHKTKDGRDEKKKHASDKKRDGDKHNSSAKRRDEEKKSSRDQKQKTEHREHKEGAPLESRTALHIASAMGNMDAVKTLLKKGARTEIKDSNGKTAEKLAVEKGWFEIAELLKIIHAARKK